jgi:hypothetical protein
MYNEKGNFFQGFFSLLPSRYFNFNGVIILPRGRAEIGKMYDLFGGTGYLQWLSNGSTYKQGEFILEWVSTKQGLTPERFKFLTMQVGTDHNTANNPSVEVNTETQTTSTSPSDLTLRMGVLGGPIYPDSSNEPIIGEYAKVRLSSSAYYRIYGLVVHFYAKARGMFK